MREKPTPWFYGGHLIETPRTHFVQLSHQTDEWTRNVVIWRV